MDEGKWARFAALGGIWFVVFSVIGAFLPGSPPSTTDSAEKVRTYFLHHSGGIRGTQFLTGIGVLGLLWWFGTLWRMMTAAENGRPRLATVALAGLGIAGALAFASGAVTSAAALQRDDLDPAQLKFLYVLAMVLLATAGFGNVVHLAAVTALSYRTKMFPSWINIVGWISAGLFLISTAGAASNRSAYLVLGLLGFLSWCLWIVGISFEMWRTPAPATSSASSVTV